MYGQWTREPKPLAKGVAKSTFSFLLDLLFALLPIPFLALGVLASKQDRVEFEHASNAHAIMGAAKYGPTVFPIIFAASVGRAMERIASMRVEKGERIGVLEQLTGSTTFFSTFSTHFQLRAFNLLGIVLMTLWVLSPVGGQASLRVVTVGSSIIRHDIPIQYLSQNNDWMLIGNDVASAKLATNALFISSLANPHTNSSMDAWENLKVPMLEGLGDLQTPTDDGWLSVHANATYATLIGLPISGLPYNMNSTFDIETSYWSLDCPVLELHSGNFTSANHGVQNRNTSEWNGALSPGLSPQFHIAIDRETVSVTSPRHILFESKGENGTSHAECAIMTIYVELRGFCDGRSCRASSVRKSKLPHPEPAHTVFDDGPLFFYFINALVSAFPAGHSAVSTPLETYFVLPESVFRSGMPWLDLYTVGSKSFATSLAQLLNTYWLAGIAPYNIANGLSMVETPDLPINVNRTTATTSESVQILQWHRGWLAVLLLAALLLFFTGVTTLVLGRLCIAPSILTYVSSLTRDNPYIPLPRGGSTLSGDERAMLLKNLVVRLGDIRPDEEFGEIALVSSYGKQGVGRLTKRRLYY